MYRINVLALIFLLVGALIGNVIGRLLFPDYPPAVELIAGSIIIASDLLTRFRRPNLTWGKRLFTREGGGQLAFIPMWLVGLVIMAIPWAS